MIKKIQMPYVIGILCSIVLITLNYLFKFNYMSPGFENILESIIGFLSIIIGFYSAFYGMIISILKSKFMKEIFKSQNRDILAKLLKQSLRLSFLSLILTIIFQLLINYKLDVYLPLLNCNFNVILLFYWVWGCLVASCIVFSYRIAMTSISMVFYSEPQKKSKIKA